MRKRKGSNHRGHNQGKGYGHCGVKDKALDVSPDVSLACVVWLRSRGLTIEYYARRRLNEEIAKRTGG